jgi:chromate transporter
MTLSEFADLLVIAEMTPGPIALTSSTFVGTQVGGLPGAVLATVGCVTPSCIIVTILGILYNKYRDIKALQGTLDGLRPAVVALIASAGSSIIMLALWGETFSWSNLAGINIIAVPIIAAGVFAMRKWKPNPIWVILGSGAVGGLLYFFI